MKELRRKPTPVQGQFQELIAALMSRDVTRIAASAGFNGFRIIYVKPLICLPVRMAAE
jgi:hypothetical protein